MGYFAQELIVVALVVAEYGVGAEVGELKKACVLPLAEVWDVNDVAWIFTLIFRQ